MSFLRKALMADGVVSGLCGLVLVAVPGLIGSLIGAPTAVVAVTGVSLLLFSFGLVRNARREAPSRGEAATTVALNVAWLLGTAVVLAGGWLTREGNWALILVGDVVLVFTALEIVALRRTAGLAGPTARSEMA